MTSRPRFRNLAVLTVTLCLLGIGASSARPPDPNLTPPVPTNVRASDGVYGHKVRITWNASAGATHYVVLRSPWSWGGAVLTNNVTGTSYDDTGTGTLDVYYYWVQACVTGDCSDLSAYDSGFRGLATPVVDASDGDYSDRVLVDWDAVPEADSYTVYRGVSSAGWQEHWTDITETFYIDYTAVAGVRYYYWVRAVSTMDESNDGQDTGYRTFSPPTGVSASDGIYTALVSVTWSAVAGNPKYQVWRDAVKAGTTTAATFSDYGAVVGALHQYGVKACNSDESICSAMSSRDGGNRRLYAPTHLSATDGTYADKVRLTWNASEGAGAYEVMRAASQGGAQTEIGTPETTTFDDTTGAAGVTYFYWVKACSFIGCSDLSGYDTGYRANPTPTRTPTRTRTRTPTPTATYTLRPTNTPGPSPTWVPGAAPRMFLPILMK